MPVDSPAFRNLQTALCAYYDTQSEVPSVELRMTPIDHLEESAELLVAPCTAFRKGWRIRNSGVQTWPTGCSLRFVSSERLRVVTEEACEADAVDGACAAAEQTSARILVPSVSAGCFYDLSAAFESPPNCGTFQFELKLCTAGGVCFGDSLWMVVKVATQMPVDETDMTLAEHIGTLRLGNFANQSQSLTAATPEANNNDKRDEQPTSRRKQGDIGDADDDNW